MFILDISAEAHSNDLFDNVVELLTNSLDSIPNQDQTTICIITVDEYIQVYRMPDDLENGPISYQICDVHDPFLPVPKDQLMLNLTKDRAKINLLLEKLPEMHTKENSKHKQAALNMSSAYILAYELLETTGGRVLAFYARIENCGPGINIVTDNHKVYNTDSEKILFTPDLGFYTDLSSKMFLKRITVDLF